MNERRGYRDELDIMLKEILSREPKKATPLDDALKARLLVLRTDRQREYAEMIRRKRLPNFFDHILNSPDRALDMTHAALNLHVSKHDEWANHHVLNRLRNKILEMSPRQLRRFLDPYLPTIYGRVAPTALINLFIVPIQDAQARQKSVRIISLISRVLAHEDALEEKHMHLSTYYLLTVLIATQNGTLTWKHFIEAFMESDPEAVATFERLWDMWIAMTKPPVFVSAEGIKRELNLEEVSRITSKMEARRGKEEQGQIPVPAQAVKYCNEWLDRRLAHMEEGLEWWKEQMIHYIQSEDVFQQHANKLWDELTHNPSHDLHPGGHDIVRISIPKMRRHGYRDIQLFPVDRFPGFRVRFWVELPLSRIRVYRQFTVTSPELVAINPECDTNTQIASKLLRWMAIRAYWSIVMGNFKKEDRHVNGNGHHHGQVSESVRLPRIPRPHYVKLHAPHWKASQYAIDRHARHWPQARLPEGRTFAMARDEAVLMQEMLRHPPNFNRPVFCLGESVLDDVQTPTPPSSEA